MISEVTIGQLTDCHIKVQVLDERYGGKGFVCTWYTMSDGAVVDVRVFKTIAALKKDVVAMVTFVRGDEDAEDVDVTDALHRVLETMSWKE